MKQKTLKKLNRYAWIMGLLAIALMLFGITTELDFKDSILTIIIILSIMLSIWAIIAGLIFAFRKEFKIVKIKNEKIFMKYFRITPLIMGGLVLLVVLYGLIKSLGWL